MSLSSLKVLDKDVTNAPGRDSAFRPNVKARARRGQPGTPAPEAPPLAQAPPQDLTARLDAPQAAQRPAAPSVPPPQGPARASARPTPVAETERPRRREPTTTTLPSPPPQTNLISDPPTARAAEPAATEGANEPVAGTKRRIPHSTTGGRRRTAYRGPAEVDEHFLATGEINTAGMTLKDILRMADAKEKERKVDDVKRTPREEDEEEQQASERPPDEPDVRALAPQIRVVDGQIVVDQQSLTASAQASNPVVSHNYRRVEETGSRLNSNSYSNRKPTKRWTDQDTVVFYKALRQFGTDFTTIQKLFPTRSRHQIKNKYLNEDRQHPKAIEAALNHKSKDSSHYEELIARLQAAAAAEEQEPENRGSNMPGGSPPEAGQRLDAAPVEVDRSTANVERPDGSVGASGELNEAAIDQGGLAIGQSANVSQGASQQSTALTGDGLTQGSQAGQSSVGEPGGDGSLGEADAAGPLTYLQRSMKRRIERGYREGD